MAYGDDLSSIQSEEAASVILRKGCDYVFILNLFSRDGLKPFFEKLFNMLSTNASWVDLFKMLSSTESMLCPVYELELLPH